MSDSHQSMHIISESYGWREHSCNYLSLLIFSCHLNSFFSVSGNKNTMIVIAKTIAASNCNGMQSYAVYWKVWVSGKR